MQFEQPFLRAGACVLLMASVAAASAQADAPSASVDVGVLRHTLSDGYGSWTQQFVRGVYQAGAADTWNAELVHARQFGDRGTLLVLGNTHQFDERWYASLSAAGSNGGFFFPRARVDLSLNRKWLATRKLVGTLGLTAIDAKDGHRDRSVLLGVAYYFDSPWVLEGGVRLNRSNPGRVASNGKYAAVTYGRQQRQILALRYGFGSEAYQYVGPSALLVDFDSHVWNATWRAWLAPRRGIQVRAEAYRNPFYARRGVELAAFQEF